MSESADPTSRRAKIERLTQAIRKRLLRDDEEYRRFGQPSSAGRPADFLLLTAGDALLPAEAFERLRWGGCLCFAAADRAEVDQQLQLYRQDSGFTIQQPTTPFHAWPRAPWLSRWMGQSGFYMVARKTALVAAGQVTDRFTFDVRLVRARPPQSGWVVLKQIPSYGSVYQRLRQRYPEASAEMTYQRTHRLIDHVFPVFLTREAAFLQLLQRDLPQAYRCRVPTALGAEKGPDGLVRRLTMSWLRLSGPPLTHLAFARQATELLAVLHERVGLIHLDLRMDNMVVTGDGVGFVDFGSAVRVGEELSQSPMLESLYDQMMSTSQIQQTLGRMIDSGRLTSSVLAAARGKVDKAVDVFYLALQMKRPDRHPDLGSLVLVDPASREARLIAALSDGVFRPADPGRPAYASARDVGLALARIERKLAGRESHDEP